MALTNTPDTYGTIAKLFHWTTAILIFAIIPLGIIASRAPIGTEEEIAKVFTLFSLHKTLGIAVFFVALGRILWALTQVKPNGLHPERKVESFTAETVHWLLYGSLVLAPLSGWIHHAALDGFAPIWWPFGQNLPLVPKDPATAHLFGNIHWIFTKVMAVSILLHVAGALKHHVIDKDATLRRMWFGKAKLPKTQTHRAPAAAPLLATAIFAVTGFIASTWHESTATTALQTVPSDWVVESGTVSIGITQLGSDVTGNFSEWTASIAFDPEAGPNFGEVTAQIAIDSLTLGTVTGQAMGADFFDQSNHPTATFAARITGTQNDYRAEGTLTIKGISAPVVLPFALQIDGDTATMNGNLTVNRRDFAIGDGTDDGSLAPEVLIQIELIATHAE